MHHRLEEELFTLVKSDERIFNFIESSCLDGLWYWDLESPEDEWMSDNFWLTFGINPKTKQHKASEWQDLINKEDLEVAFENFTKHCEDPNHPYDQIVRYQHAQGHTVWIRCKGMAIRDSDGKAIRMLGAHTDVTELKKTEIALLETIQKREKFFARMSHEIRTPLHGVIGITDILRAKNKDPELKAGLDTISACGEQLLVLLDDLLTIGSLNEDQLKVSIEEVPLTTITNYVSNLYRARATAKGLDFIVEMPPDAQSLSIISDKIRFTQVLSNLINNAIKFTDSGTVKLNVQMDGDDLVFSVSDSGRGINDIKAVCEPYTQENADLADIQGSGLGLEIVHRLCRELGHSIVIESEVGKGTAVKIHCKKRYRTAPTRVVFTNADLAIESFSSMFGNVLIVDDNDINCDIAAMMLEGECQRIDTAKDGGEAVKMMARNKDYDIVLMDLNMPVKDGYEAAIEILAMPELKTHPVIIAVSADAFEETIQRCRNAGMIGHLKKPFNKEKLVATIADSLATRKAIA